MAEPEAAHNERQNEDWEAGDPSSTLSAIAAAGSPYPDGEAPTLDELLEQGRAHDHACCPPDDCCGGPCAAHPCWDLTT